MKLVQGSELFAEISRAYQMSKRVRLAVAFWGDGATSAIGIDQKPEAVSIVCNLRMGGTNPREIRRLLDLGVSVKHLDTLHAKLYLFDDFGVVGSSNMSANGLSLQGAEVGGWLEANILFSLGTVYTETEDLFDKLWVDAKEITENDLLAAQAVWDRRRRAYVFGSKVNAKSIFKLLKDDHQKLSDMGIYLTVDFDPISAAGSALLETERSESGAGSELSAWEGWGAMPNGATFISFHVDYNNDITFEGLWTSPTKRYQRKVPGGRWLQFIREESNIRGIKSIGPISAWRNIVGMIVSERGKNKIIAIEIGYLAKKYISNLRA